MGCVRASRFDSTREISFLMSISLAGASCFREFPEVFWREVAFEKCVHSIWPMRSVCHACSVRPDWRNLCRALQCTAFGNVMDLVMFTVRHHTCKSCPRRTEEYKTHRRSKEFFKIFTQQRMSVCSFLRYWGMRQVEQTSIQLHPHARPRRTSSYRFGPCVPLVSFPYPCRSTSFAQSC